MSESNDSENETTAILRDVRFYLRIQTAISLREEAKGLLDSREKAEIYDRLDGTKTHLELSKLVRVPRKTVTNWVREFVHSGIAVDVRGLNDRALFTLEELGVSVKSLPRRGRRPH